MGKRSSTIESSRKELLTYLWSSRTFVTFQQQQQIKSQIWVTETPQFEIGTKLNTFDFVTMPHLFCNYFYSLLKNLFLLGPPPVIVFPKKKKHAIIYTIIRQLWMKNLPLSAISFHRTDSNEIHTKTELVEYKMHTTLILGSNLASGVVYYVIIISN